MRKKNEGCQEEEAARGKDDYIVTNNECNVNYYNGYFPLPSILKQFERKAFGLTKGKVTIDVFIKDGRLKKIIIKGGGDYAPGKQWDGL